MTLTLKAGQHRIKRISDPLGWFEQRIVVEGDCWIWQMHRNRNGYGTTRGLSMTSMDLAHRVAYELFVGPIPEGMTIDHVVARGCHSRACCNPGHLEAVTQLENVRRGAHHGGLLNAAKTHCPKGHEYNDVNTHVDSKSGSRHCRTCWRERARAKRQGD